MSLFEKYQNAFIIPWFPCWRRLGQLYPWRCLQSTGGRPIPTVTAASEQEGTLCYKPSTRPGACRSKLSTEQQVANNLLHSYYWHLLIVHDGRVMLGHSNLYARSTTTILKCDVQVRQRTLEDGRAPMMAPTGCIIAHTSGTRGRAMTWSGSSTST